jgi:hypothetical protein
MFVENRSWRMSKVHDCAEVTHEPEDLRWVTPLNRS